MGRQPISSERRSADESSIRVWDMVAGTSNAPSRSVSKREAVRAFKEALAFIASDYRQAVSLLHDRSSTSLRRGEVGHEAGARPSAGCTEIRSKKSRGLPAEVVFA